MRREAGRGGHRPGGLLRAAGGPGDLRLEAASITVVQANGNTVFDNSNAANEVDFKAVWNTNLPVQLEAGDTGPAAYLSGFHVNLTGIAWHGFDIELAGGPTWGAINPDHIAPGATVRI